MKGKKMKKKMIISAVLTCVLCIGTCITAQAATPPLKIDMPEISGIGNVRLPDSLTDSISQIVDEHLKEHASALSGIKKPQITQAIYRHRIVFWDRAKLQVSWKAVKGAEYYEVKIQKGQETDLRTVYGTLLTVYDDTCLKGASVQVRAVAENGMYSEWSDVCTVVCTVWQ